MISIESRDGRKSLGLGFGSVREMEETELEEGEAYDYHDDDDANIDPDVDLSYLDEKVQDVLGHFQKDFEGGVSAENLGAKFGGYGSFLPTYQRSPSIWSQPRTPQKVPSHGTPRSPNNLQLEGDLQNSAVPSGASSSAKHVTGTTSAAPPPSSRAFLESSSKRENLLSARSSVDYNINNELLNKPNTMADQKTLKVRLKVGSDNVAQKTAAIFSDLGFPPSSPEDSPAESGGLSPESRESPYESPRSILQIMTSSPVLHGALLPPLPDGLLHLTEKQKISKENRPSVASRAGQGTSTVLVDESNSVMEEGKFLSGKKVKAVEKGNRLIEMKHEAVKDVGNGLDAFLNKEIDTGTPDLADSPRQPVLSNSKIKTGETMKGTGRAPEVSVEIKRFKFKDKSISSDFAKEDSESIDISEKLKPSANSGDKVWEDRKEKVRKDVHSLSRKDNKSKTNKSYDSCNTSFDGSKGRKELNGGTIDPLENKIKLKMTSFDEGQLPYGTEQAFSSGKKKLKGSKNNGNSTAIFSQESLRAVSSTAPREKRKSSADSSSRNKGDDSKLSREFGKTRETYRDIFGDEEMEQAENSHNSVEMPFRDRPKDYKSEVIAKGKPQFADKPKDKTNAKQIYQFADKSRDRQNSKKAVNPPISEAYEAPVALAPSTANGLVSETVSSIAVPVLVKDHWVCCDTCQKWRLLPHGVDPDDLPKKWSCSMFIWLPGMNSCKISEDVTTNAMNVMNGAPGAIPTGSQNNMQNQPNGAAALQTLPEGQHLDSKSQDHNLPAVPGGGKKKHGLKEIADANNLTGTMRFSSAVKNQQASLKSRSLNDVNQSPLDSNLANKAGIQHLSRSNDSAVEKHKHKQKDGHKLAQDEGVGYHSKVKSKREADYDGSRASKKIKREGLLNMKEEWNSDNGGVSGSLAPPVKKNGDYSFSKESKFDSKDSLPSSAKKPKELHQVPSDVGASDMRGLDGRDISAKKRKVKEWQENQVYPSEPHTNANHHLESNKVSMEGTSESDLRKGKKARVSKSEGKMSCKSMGDAGVDKRERASRILNSVSRDCLGDEIEKSKGHVSNDQRPSERGVATVASQPMVDCVDPFKKDLAYVMPSLAATSSSSKVSGSRKSKANFQEAKGSPVESVSSSPLRIPDKGTSARRIQLGKDEATNGGFAANGSLRKCSDGEGDGGGFHSGSVRKEKAYSATHRRSSESSVFDYQNREVNLTSSGKAKAPDDSVCVVGAGTLDQRIQHMELLGKEHGHDDDQANKHYGSISRKSSKSSSVRSKDKLKGSKSDIDKGKVKRSDSLNNQDGIYPTKNSRNDAETEPHDLHYREESRVGKYTSQEKNGVKGGKDEKSYLGKKEYEKWSNEGRRENQSRHGVNVGTDVKFSGACSKDEKSNEHRNYTQLRVGEKSSHQSLSDRADHDHMETASRRGKSQAFLQSGDKLETQTRCPRPMSSNHKGNGTDLLRVDGSNCGGGDESKVVKQPRKPDSQSGSAHNNSLSHSTPGRVNVGDLDGPSPARKDSSSQAANAALKEARDLKHSADRLKNSGSGLESTGLYFEAVLKFLHGASLLEPCNIESSRHGESQSVHVYSTTTSLCEFVAQEYERCKEMAFAALAYKCLEVACMRVVYFKHWSINKDRHELQAALHMVPPGESPSSSASDVDNQGTADKVALAKGVGSPHVAGNHVIAARSRPNFVRVLNFTQDVNSAMEASRKSQNAFAAASATLEDTQCEGISSVKRALDFNFNDVQGLLRLVRVAMEAISR